MIFKRSLMVGLTVLLALSLSLPVFAQDDAAEETEPLEASQATELTQTETLGEVALAYPEGWSSLLDGSGAIVLGNVELEALNQANTPDDALFLQMFVLGLNLLPEVESGADAQTILEAIRPEEEANIPVTTLENGDQRPVARIDRSNEESDGIIYVAALSDDLFTMVVAIAQPGEAAAYEETIVNIMDAVMVDITTSVETESLALYEGLTTGTSEEGFPQLGNPDAPVEVVEISSFDCPACAFFHSEIFPLMVEDIAAGNVLFTYVPVYGTGGIPAGDAAARASMCAQEQDAFWPYHSGLFEWQAFGNLAFVTDRLLGGADELGLDVDTFETCLASEDVDTVLETAFETARNNPDFAGTPTLLVNGTAVSNSADDLLTAIDVALGEDGEPNTDEESD